MPLPPAPPAPPVRQNDDRTRQFNPENPNKTTVMPAQQADPEATTRLALEKNDVPANNVPASPSNGPVSGGQPKRSGKRAPVIIAVVAAIVLACAGGGGYAWWYFRGPGSYWTMPQPADLTCSDSEPCRISNIKWNAYEELLKFSNIEYEETERSVIPSRLAMSSPPTRRMSVRM